MDLFYVRKAEVKLKLPQMRSVKNQSNIGA